MEQRHIDEGSKNPVLGPHYFSAREVAEKFMAQFEAEHFEPLIKKFSEGLYEKLLDDVQNYLITNCEMNLQGEIWRGTDDSVMAILTGERWALERYALGDRHDGQKVRAAVATHIPVELQDARVKDLEAEVERLRKDVEFYRRDRG